jgi:hypothetical protein
MTDIAPDLDLLTQALVASFVSLTPDETRLVATAYRLLAEGFPVDLSTLAEASDWELDGVESRLASWPGGVYLDDRGRLIGLWGMTVEPISSHQLRLQGKAPVWMWCALDPLFIVPLLGEEAKVTSTSPVTGEQIELDFGPDGTVRSVPPSTVVSMLMPKGSFGVEVRQSFCHFVHFFESPAAAKAWTVGHAGTYLIDLSAAVEVGRTIAQRAFATAGGGGVGADHSG